MQIEKLKIVGLYGYITKEIDFNNDLTLLVGINGSGKTSILNIVNWLLKPSIADLCVTEFKILQLLFNWKGSKYQIVCKHNKTTLKYEIITEKETYHPLTVRLPITPSKINNDESLKTNLLQNYIGLAPDQKEKKTWEFISTIPSPTVIGLDRNIYTEEVDRVYIEESIRGKIMKKPASIISPLDRVKEIVNREYRKKKNSILQLTSNLKNYLMLSTFDGSITIQSISDGNKHKLNLNQIEGAEKRINNYFKNFETKILTESEKSRISKYFSQLKEVVEKYQESPNDDLVKIFYTLNANQFIKVIKLLKEFEKFEAESTKALEQINQYLATLNSFFKDSSKELLFREDTSELTFNALDQNGNVISKHRDIKFLSSGEQQVLILFSYIAFNSEDGRIFIIDEPELSLHIKWQEEFLDQLEKITPKYTQLILATHSPILANRKREKVKVLLPYNN